MIKHLALSFCLFYTHLSAQDSGRIGTTSMGNMSLPQGFVLSSINSAGFSKLITNQVSNVGSINPASIVQFNNFSFGFSYQFETDINPAWLVDMVYSRELYTKPQSVSIAGKIDNIGFAMSYYQRYNSFISFGELELSTIEQPDGTGETFSVDWQEYVDTYSMIVSYTLDETPEITLGTKIDVNFLNMEESIYRSTANASGIAISAAFGFNYKVSENIIIGAFYEKGPEFKEKIKLDDDLLVELEPADRGNNNRVALTPNISLKSKLPNVINFAASIRLNKKYTYVIDLDYIFWQQLNESYKNNLDISSNLIADLKPDISLCFGLLLTDRNYKNGDLDLNSKLQALYLLVGFKREFELIALNIAIASSHLQSGKWREQFIAKAGIDFYF